MNLIISINILWVSRFFSSSCKFVNLSWTLFSLWLNLYCATSRFFWSICISFCLSIFTHSNLSQHFTTKTYFCCLGKPSSGCFCNEHPMWMQQGSQWNRSFLFHFYIYNNILSIPDVGVQSVVLFALYQDSPECWAIWLML